MSQSSNTGSSTNVGTQSAILAIEQGKAQILGHIAQLLASAFPLSTFNGTFTAAPSASTTVADTNVKKQSLIFWSPTSASAATLIGSAANIYLSAISPGQNFVLSTANGSSAAGTEKFSYLIINAG